MLLKKEVITSDESLANRRLKTRSMAPELNVVRMVSLLKAITPGWVTGTNLFTLVIDYNHYYDSFEELQANPQCFISAGLAYSPAYLKEKYIVAQWIN